MCSFGALLLAFFFSFMVGKLDYFPRDFDFFGVGSLTSCNGTNLVD